MQASSSSNQLLPRTSFFLDAEGRFVVLRDLEGNEGNVVLRDLDFGFFFLSYNSGPL